MRLKEYGSYAADIRAWTKRSLEESVLVGFDKKREQLEELSTINYSLSDLGLQERIDNLQIEKQLCEKVLNDEGLLGIYLDGVVKDGIIRLLTFIAAGPNEESCFDFATRAFEKMGFVDAEEYLEEFNSVEDVRKDLFEQSNLKYISNADLMEDLMKAREDFDLDMLAATKANFEKAGISEYTGRYEEKSYILCELAMMTEEQVRLLAREDSSIIK